MEPELTILLVSSSLVQVRHVLDDYYLAITFLVTLGWQLIGFFMAYALQVDKFTDLWGGINVCTRPHTSLSHFPTRSPLTGSIFPYAPQFFVLALMTLLMSGAYTNARSLVASICVMVWSARLGGFLFFRVLKTGSDGRFDEMRGKFFKFAGFWAFQVLWVWVVSLPTGESSRWQRGEKEKAELTSVDLSLFRPWQSSSTRPPCQTLATCPTLGPGGILLV